MNPNTSPNFSCGRTRRQFLWQAGNGFFGTALTWMLAKDGVQAGETGIGSPLSLIHI